MSDDVRGIRLEELRRLLEQGAQLVEVLPEKEYREQHLPGAIHIPLTKLTPQAAAALDRNRPVIVYCWDYQ
ncbi:MAG TPA: rhodanese-like domain-containing protein [Dehalococcoidia bacterium]|nr:rhodanese-like domain-containing protein [Dehalococcoidia bacterium]